MTPYRLSLVGKSFTADQLTQVSNDISDQYLRDAAAAADFYDGDNGYHNVDSQTLPIESPTPEEKAAHLNSLK